MKISSKNQELAASVFCLLGTSPLSAPATAVATSSPTAVIGGVVAAAAAVCIVAADGVDVVAVDDDPVVVEGMVVGAAAVAIPVDELVGAAAAAAVTAPAAAPDDVDVSGAVVASGARNERHSIGFFGATSRTTLTCTSSRVRLVPITPLARSRASCFVSHKRRVNK